MRTALNNPSLGWTDRRVIQLTNDLLLSTPIIITTPVRIEGNCEGSPNGRCTIRAAKSTPLLNITGPAALVKLGNLDLAGGQAVGGMGGAITTSNASQLEISSCTLTSNSAAMSGGAILIDGNSHVTFINSEASNNVAGQRGGAIHVLEGTLHMDGSTVTGNSAATAAGIFVNVGSYITIVDSNLRNNMLRGAGNAPPGKDDIIADNENNDEKKDPKSEDPGSDLVLESTNERGRTAGEAFFKPLPKPGTLSVQGSIQDLADLHGRLPGETAPEAEFGQQRKLPPALLAALKKAVQSRKAKQGSKSQAVSEAEVERELVKQLFGEEEAEMVEQKRPLPEDRPIGEHIPLHIGGRKLFQAANNNGPFPANARVVDVASEQELAEAIKNKERFINLVGHITLTGDFPGQKSLLPSIVASVSIIANCSTPYNGKCLIKGSGTRGLLYVDNAGFLPGMEVLFKNVIFTNGRAEESGGAVTNSGAMAVTFEGCEFYNNLAGMAGAVSLVEGAFGVFTDCIFRKNAAATDGSGSGLGGAVLLTGQAGFTRCTFESNTAQNGGAVGVGGSSEGIFFDGCTFNVRKTIVGENPK